MKGVSRKLRNKTINRILRIHAGVYALEACEICGEFKEYHGYISGLATHYSKMFVCFECRKPLLEREYGWSLKKELVEDIIKKRGFRYCALCLGKIHVRDPQGINYKMLITEYGICEDCRKKYRQKGWHELVIRRRKRRYLENIESWEKLRSVEIQIWAQRINIDELEGKSLKKDKDEKVEKIIKKLEYLHRADYSDL